MKRKTIVMLLAAMFAAGCANTNISKEMQGTMAGATAGAIAGAQVGGVRGAIIGGVIGGVVGNRIGAHLDEQDRKKLAELEERALKTGKGGSFVSGKSKSRVSVTAQQAVTEADPERKLMLPADVARQSLAVTAVDKAAALVETPVYGDISEKYAPKRIIRKGEPINVVANVANKQWGVVAENGTIVGYVPLRYLNKGIEKQAPKSFAKAVPSAPRKVVAQSDRPKANAAAAAPSTAVQPVATAVQVARVCKVTIIKLDSPNGGTPLEEKNKYCSDPPPQWKLVSA